MNNETRTCAIVIPQVDPGELDLHRKTIAGLSMRGNDLSEGEQNAICGLLNMLDTWSDDFFGHRSYEAAGYSVNDISRGENDE